MEDRKPAYLIHYGVPGMKWGRRKAATLKTWGKEAGKLTVNSLKHPILSNRADRESMNSDTLKKRVRRASLYKKTDEIRDVNKRLDKMVADKAARKQHLKEMRGAKRAERQEAAKKYVNSLVKSDWVKEAGKLTVNSLKHPILSNRADRESMNSDTLKKRVRRASLYKKTDEIRDVNKRLDKMVADKREKRSKN